MVWVLFVGVYIWICVLDYLNKTQDSRSFGAKPPCQDLMKIWKIYNYFSMKNKNKNITTKFRKSKSGGKSGVVSALDYTRLLPSVQYVKTIILREYYQLCRILESPQKHFWRIVLINAYSPDFLSLTRLLCKASSCGLSTARLISMKGWLGCSQSPRPTNFPGKSQQTTPTLAILRLEWISFLFEQVWNWKCLIWKVWTSDLLPKNTSIPRLPHITRSWTKWNENKHS